MRNIYNPSSILSSIFLYACLSGPSSYAFSLSSSRGSVRPTTIISSRLLSTTAIAQQGTETSPEEQIHTDPRNEDTIVNQDSSIDKRPRTNFRNRTRMNNQEKYGLDLELPKTYIKCGRCSTCFAIQPEDLGNGKGCRVECSVCSHSWFQSRDRVMNLDDGLELVSLPSHSTTRIAANIKAGREPGYLGAIKFYVGNLSFDVNENDLKTVFEVVGEVGDVSIATNPDGRSRGFAFVTMMNEEDGEGCLKLDGYELKGRNMNVKKPNN